MVGWSQISDLTRHWVPGPADGGEPPVTHTPFQVLQAGTPSDHHTWSTCLQCEHTHGVWEWGYVFCHCYGFVFSVSGSKSVKGTEDVKKICMSEC